MKNQQGKTFIGMVFSVIGVVLMGILLMKIVPVYMENYSISKSIHVMNKLTGPAFSSDRTSTSQAIRDRLIKQFEMNGLYHLDTQNLEVTPSEREDIYRIKMDYQVIKPLFFNMSLLFVFHEEQEVTIAKGE